MKHSKWKPVWIGIVIAAVILGSVYLYQQINGQASVTTTGTYQTKVAPDQASASLQIQTKADTAEEAKNENAIISDDVLTGLLKAGIEMKDIETENYNVYPEYNWTSGYQEIIGYTATNSITVTTKDFMNLGKIIDAGVDNGATVSYINFELSIDKNNEYKALVLANASSDAKNKASAIASGLGKKVGKIVSISTDDYNYYPYPIYRSDSAGSTSVKEVATNIQPTSLDIQATVTVTYKIY
jgi:uncharacterized protein YggE